MLKTTTDNGRDSVIDRWFGASDDFSRNTVDIWTCAVCMMHVHNFNSSNPRILALIMYAITRAR